MPRKTVLVLQEKEAEIKIMRVFSHNPKCRADLSIRDKNGIKGAIKVSPMVLPFKCIKEKSDYMLLPF